MSFYRRHGIIIIAFSFLMALLLSIIPWPTGFSMLRPSWVMLILIYWIAALPHRVNIGYGFIVGLLLDLLLGAPLGLHALTMSVIAYIIALQAQFFRNLFLWQQALLIVVLSLFSEVLDYWLAVMFEKGSFHPQIFWASVVNGLLWPWLFLFMRKIRRYFLVQ